MPGETALLTLAQADTLGGAENLQGNNTIPDENSHAEEANPLVSEPEPEIETAPEAEPTAVDNGDGEDLELRRVLLESHSARPLTPLGRCVDLPAIETTCKTAGGHFNGDESSVPTRDGSLPPRLICIPILECVAVVDMMIWIQRQARKDNHDPTPFNSLTPDLLRDFNLAGKELADGCEDIQNLDDRWLEAGSWVLLLCEYFAPILRTYRKGHSSDRDPNMKAYMSGIDRCSMALV